ncbi:MAG: hypothetical protein QOJ35_3282 [Solirubrobacteraceae bacterium]|nr:hypothetical protein [Solirubrobacteraceae bacterium]
MATAETTSTAQARLHAPVDARAVHARRSEPPDPAPSVPTRLIGGPLVFRIHGAIGPTPAMANPTLRFVLIYRLNRPRLRLPKDPRDPEGPTPLPPGARTSLGNISLANLQYTWDYSAGEYDPEEGPDQDNCFIGTVSDDAPWALRVLDGIPDGGRVRVRLRPLTPKPSGGAKLGNVFLRHPRIRTMRVKPDDLHGLFNQVASPGALKALRRIGCSATVL